MHGPDRFVLCGFYDCLCSWVAISVGLDFFRPVSHVELLMRI
jgi:hypothetical protein